MNSFSSSSLYCDRQPRSPMESMTLGSPSGSALSGTSGTGYLPSFLMGDPPSTPRPTTLSPTRGRSSLGYAQHGLLGSPPDGMRSPPMHYHHQQQSQQHMSTPFVQPHTHQGHHQPHAQRFLQNSSSQMPNMPNQYRNESFEGNSSIIGPPTQGLFDSWRKEKQMLSTAATRAQHGPAGNAPEPAGASNPSFSESFQNQSGFNVSRVMSPIPVASDHNRIAGSSNSQTSPASYGNQQQQTAARSSSWVTVFGFPQNAAAKILSHFIGIGTIVDKQTAPQGGNWVHLRYSSRIECDRAVNYNGRIISQGLMIGVQYCTDPAVLGKENEGDTTQGSSPDKPLWRVRSLMNMSYSTMQDPQAVISTPPVQKRSNGIVNKAMDIFFGW